jgi:hypothetical protein
MTSDNSQHNFRAFVWHASWLGFTVTFTEVNTVLPGLIVEVGGSQIHVGILTAIMVGAPMLTQLLFAGFLTPKPRKKPFLLLGIYLRVAALAGVAWTLSHLTSINPVGTRLIFLGLRVVTNAVSCTRLSDCVCREGVPGKSPRITSIAVIEEFYGS